MSAKRVRKDSKFLSYMKRPIKILARARDFYIRSLTGCAGAHVTYGNAMGCPTPQLSSLPRSFSTNSYSTNRDEDLKELIRIASTRSLTGRVEAEFLRQQKSSQAAMPRSRTVTIGRIDENNPYEFGGDHVGRRSEFYPRSRSYAASTRSNIMV